MGSQIYYEYGGKKFKSIIKDDNKIAYSRERAGGANPIKTTFSDIGLKKGDIIQTAKDQNGYITAINVVYRIDQTSALKDYAWLSGQKYDLSFTGYDGEGAASAIVNAIDTENGILQYSVTNDAGENIYNIKVESADISVYRKEENETESIKLSSLREGDFILVRTQEGYAASAAQILVIR